VRFLEKKKLKRKKKEKFREKCEGGAVKMENPYFTKKRGPGKDLGKLKTDSPRLGKKKGC